MGTWAKYLIIGWSMVSIGIIIVAFQVMEEDFIEKDFDVVMIYKTPEKASADLPSNLTAIGEDLFYGKDEFDNLSITKEQFVERMKKAKGITIQSKNRIKDRSIYIYLPIYGFAIWAIPILVFSLLGNLFIKKRD